MTTQMGSESRKRDRTINGGSSSATGAEGDRLQEAATNLADQAGRTVETQASTVMTKAGEQFDQVARAIRDAGNNLRQERPEIANYADTAAQRVEDAGRYLREHDARDVADSAQDFARRQPAVIVAGGLALGLLVGRFLRSGMPQGQSGGSGSAGYGSPSNFRGESSYSGGGTSYGYGTDVDGLGTTASDVTADTADIDADTAKSSSTSGSTRRSKSRTAH